MTGRGRKDLDEVLAVARALVAALERLAPPEPRQFTLSDGELLDVNEVAAVLGLTNSKAVAVYRGRPRLEFPEPALVKLEGRCLLWWKADIVAWSRKHPGKS